MNSRSDRRYWSEAWAVAWLLLIAALVWMHARQSSQPPVYDAFTYYEKARSIWIEIHDGHLGLKHLLNVEPSFRPPGTTLMAYPFGFDADYRPFYFRSVFFPIALVFGSVFVATWRPESPWRSRRLTALTAAFLSTVSLFYYFEPYAGGPPAVSHWGLVDGWLTGLAALATAAGVRSILSRSVRWGVVATLVGVVAIFSKPTGVVIAAIAASIAGIGWLWNLRQTWSLVAQRRRVLWRTLLLFVLQIILLGTAVVLATHSNYLGPMNMMYGNAAIDVMRAELTLPFRVLLNLVQKGLGPFILVWAVSAGSLWVYRRWRTRRVANEARGTDDLLAVLSGAALVLGLWFWLVASGGQTQIRYFAPFLYVAFACALPALIRMLSSCAPLARRLVCAVMLAGVANITVLLALPDPALAWQLASGVNVKSGSRSVGILQAQAVIAATPADAPTVFVYSFVQGITDAMFESVFNMQYLAAASPRFAIRRPIDWQRQSTFRIDEIVTSNYILFHPVRQRAAPPARVDDFVTEQAVFESWAEGLTAADGIERLSVDTDSVLLRIADRAAVRRSLEALVAAHRWREVFLAENVAKWWSEGEVVQSLAQSPADIEHVDFEGKFDLRAMSLARLPDGRVEMKIWLRPRVDVREGDWILLTHLVNARGLGIVNRDMSLGVMEVAPEGRPYWYFHQTFAPPREATQVGIGFYRGAIALTADRGMRDDGGTRVLMRLPAATP